MNNNFLKNARWQERQKTMRPRILSKIGGIIFLAAIAGSVMAGVLTLIRL